MNVTDFDLRMMQRALELARAGIGLAAPNPCVGAVVVDAAGEIAGQGTHTYDGRKHAEVLALDQAGVRAHGATLYLNLEPCSHQGRTGPCADRVVAAGVRRVFAAMQDPNPAVSGRGFARLREAGVEVQVGLLQPEARRLNEAFTKWIRTGLPLVTLKSAMTLDGKIAAAGAAREWITGEAARAHVHLLRHQADAILVGVGTVLQDDPALTDRSGLPRRRPLLRVVLDSHLRTPIDSQLVKTAAGNVLILCSAAAAEGRERLTALGVEVEAIQDDSRLEFRNVLSCLGKRQILNLLVEGGSAINGAALAAGVVDKVFLYYAPKILGGSQSIPYATGPGFPSIAAAATVQDLTLHRFGDDFAVEGYLRDPYAVNDV